MEMEIKKEIALQARGSRSTSYQIFIPHATPWALEGSSAPCVVCVYIRISPIRLYGNNYIVIHVTCILDYTLEDMDIIEHVQLKNTH